MKIDSSYSHLDHGLSEAHLDFLMETFGNRTSPFKETVDIPAHLPALPSLLHADVPEAEALYEVRGSRPNLSRLCLRPAQESRRMTVVAAMHAGECVLVTAHGGEAALREPGDPFLLSEEKDASLKFWSTHALSKV